MKAKIQAYQLDPTPFGGDERTIFSCWDSTRTKQIVLDISKHLTAADPLPFFGEADKDVEFEIEIKITRKVEKIIIL